MTTSKLSNIESGVLVQLRPGRYWRDSVTGQSYSGRNHYPEKSKKYKPGSPPFRISKELWERDCNKGREIDRLFEKVED